MDLEENRSPWNSVFTIRQKVRFQAAKCRKWTHT
jgi:hypothetical protein